MSSSFSTVFWFSLYHVFQVLGKQAMIENKLEQTAECIYNPEEQIKIIKLN